MAASVYSRSSELGAPSPVAEAMLKLAPLHLPNRRRVRYLGDDFCVVISSLAERDQALIRKLYANLTELLFALADTRLGDLPQWEKLARWVERHPLDALIDEVREVGSHSHSQQASEALSKVMHDVRGGALSALLGRLQLLHLLPRTDGELNTLFILARDHLKIMRNALTGLDDERRQADHSPKKHDVQLILTKWHDSVVGPNWQERPVRLTVDCRHRGALTECCLESAAIDRIFYNLANNACRHAATGRMDMVIFPVPEAPGDCLRFVLSNEVDAKDAASLRALTQTEGIDGTDEGAGQNLLPLFEAQVSSTGSGYGLTVVADFVAGAFGLSGRAEALRERYVGAVLDGHTFRVWFHWPLASNALPPKLDDRHQLQESLSEPEPRRP